MYRVHQPRAVSYCGLLNDGVVRLWGYWVKMYLLNMSAMAGRRFVLSFIYIVCLRVYCRMLLYASSDLQLLSYRRRTFRKKERSITVWTYTAFVYDPILPLGTKFFTLYRYMEKQNAKSLFPNWPVYNSAPNERFVVVVWLARGFHFSRKVVS